VATEGEPTNSPPQRLRARPLTPSYRVLQKGFPSQWQWESDFKELHAAVGENVVILRAAAFPSDLNPSPLAVPLLASAAEHLPP
jgi:hypothetical protein